MNEFTVGTDPEFFGINSKGKYMSLIGKLGGSKEDPKKTVYGWVQEDNVAGEFNIPPAYTRDQFRESILNVLGEIKDFLQPLDLTVDISPIAKFSKDQLKHPKALLAGCEPDYDAWKMSINNPPDLSATQFRSAGGHLHIGWNRVNDSQMHRAYLCRVMDMTAGIPFVLIDDNEQRRKLYGKAGCHRPKYLEEGDAFDGVEYRTLSNKWLSSPNLIDWAYNSVEAAITRFEEFMDLLEDGVISGEEVVRIINQSDAKAAAKFCKTYNIEVA